MELNPTDTLRLLNSVVALLAGALLATRAIPKWDDYTVRMRYFIMALGNLLLVTALGSVEQVFFGTAVRTPLVTASVTFALIGVTMRDTGYVKDGRPQTKKER